jgi:membrane protease YdiL (CAAX protease family)
MNDLPERENPDNGGDLLAVVPAPPKKGWPWLAWPVILALVVLFAFAGHYRQEHPPAGEEGEMEDALLRMQARYAVGAAQATGHGKTLLEQLRTLDSGPVPQRLRFVVLAGELAGPQEAQKYLRQIESEVAKKTLQPTADQATLLDILRRLYRDYSHDRVKAPDVQPRERAEVESKLGWFGELALAPAGSPDASRREELLHGATLTFWTSLLAIFTAIALAGIGLICLIVFVILIIAGKLRDGLPSAIRHDGVYAETFAVWLVLFAGFSLLAALAGFPEETALLWQGLGMLLSLLALGWPVLRGIPWTQVRQDLGLTLGRQPLLEPLFGIGCYVMALPLVAVGFVIVIVITLIENSLAGPGAGSGLGPVSRASHPIVRYLAHGDWRVRLQILFLASVVAPLVEETMFRGVLYRHLREASRRFGTLVSFVVSGTVVSLLFAVVHPQGLLAVPLLMSLALGFALAREWRGSLMPSMIAHGLNNGMVLLLAMLALGE